MDRMATVEAQPLLEMTGIEKTFPGVRALRGVNLDLHYGEVLALLGENGAGKSTLMKVLGGAVAPGAGEIRIGGETAQIRNPLDARRLGVAMIHQELQLVPYLSARENIFLGQDLASGGFIRRGEERRAARELFARLGVELDPEVPCGELTVAQQQAVEIAKALASEAKIIVMDEPTAALTSHEVERLFNIISDLKARGIGVIYISHRLDEIFRVADRVTILRDGAHVGTRAIQAITRREMIEMMVGRKIENEFPKKQAAIGAERLVVRGLGRGGAVRDVSFSIRAGETLGLTGLVGAGRTELARLIFGADRPDRGEIWLDGKKLRITSPRDAIASGVCLLTEDRKTQGLSLEHSVRENFALPNFNHLSAFGLVRGRAEREAFGRHVESLNIKIPHQEQLARNLSGGNQQKLVLAKWLERNCEVVIFDEPTRGVDVGAKYEIYLLMNRLAAAGKAILMISSELPEALGMSDRILVMSGGRIAGEIEDARTATQERIMELAVSGLVAD